jgi:hypothetical protein
MSRGIFHKRNGQWRSVVAPSIKQGNVWTPVTKGFYKTNGTWQQFYPGNVTADLLVVGGGGGGGIGYGYEGGGGGGAGGVLLVQNRVLSVETGTSFKIIVGAGGGANTSGTNSVFGLGGTLTVNTSNVPIYDGTYPVYNGFLNTYGVWTHPGMSGAAPGTVSVTYTTVLEVGGTFTLRVSADNAIDVSIDGVPRGSNGDWAYYNDSFVDLTAGSHTIVCTATNYGGPAMFSAALYDLGGRVVWNTRSPLTEPTRINGIVALGGGNGGWGTTEQTAGSGGSGGGGCGYVYTKSGGSGYPGQGSDGGTGVWQGFGQAGGGGGGGFAGVGQVSNGNQGGAGGAGVNLLGFSVAGGGGGGYGNQGPFGDGPPGEGGAGGGGRGNGGDAEPNTGGGGGGSLHNAATGAGRGGDGLIVVRYAGAPLYTGGAISTSNGVVTHVFTTSGELTAL